jgi:hypothetical protein
VRNLTGQKKRKFIEKTTHPKRAKISPPRSPTTPQKNYIQIFILFSKQEEEINKN